MDRTFTAKVENNTFVITEVTSSGISRELAWQKARSQANPTVFVALDGTRRELGDTFDTETFEQAMYSGHVSYELSMTDGFYAPKSFETWVKVFREFPTTRYIDATPETLAAMDRYLAKA